MRAASILTFCAGATLLGLASIFLYRGSLVQLSGAINEIDISHRPYMVSIERQGLHHCAGAIISTRFVLTSAYCFRSVTNYSVRAGSDIVQQGGSQHAISQIIIHPKYSVFEVAFDIALVMVSPHFMLSRNLCPVRLAEFADRDPADSIAELCGWGHTKDPTEESRTLRRVEVHVLHRDVCSALNPQSPAPTPLPLCGSYRGNKDKDPYVGDLGAPLMVRGAAVGVASWRLLMSPGPAPGPYGFFVSVPALRPWIDQHSHIAADDTAAASAAESNPRRKHLANEVVKEKDGRTKLHSLY